MEKGDIVHIDYELWIVDSNELFDATNESLAREHDIYDEKKKYKPLPTIVGVGKVVKGLDESLLNAKVGERCEVEIPPEKAYGERDPRLVELHSKREIMRLPEFRGKDKEEAEPRVGMQIALKNRIGTITAVTAGRVRVDFNNPLAGKTLKYNYTIVDRAETLEDKISAILEMHYGTSEDFEISVDTDNNEGIVGLPDQCKYDLGWFQKKYRVVSDLREFTSLETIKLVETYGKKVKKEKEEEEEKEEKEEKT